MIDILYFSNPMCSWCWGFGPVLRQFAERHQQLVNLSLLLGSLGDRGHKPMSAHDRSHVRQHWQHVQELTGQPFDLGFFDRETFIYDTEPPSRAVAVIRSIYPALGLSFFAHLQERFYAHNDDITDPAVLEAAAANFNVEAKDFRDRFETALMRDAVRQEWEQTASLGVSGYPTLLAVRDGKPRVLTIGYRPFDQIDETFREVAGLTAEPAGS